MIPVFIYPCHIDRQGAALDQFTDVKKGAEGESLAVCPGETAVPGSFDVQGTAGPTAHGDGHINHPELFSRARKEDGIANFTNIPVEFPGGGCSVHNDSGG